MAGSSRSGSVVGRATREGFTFASLSELGNPQPKRSQSSSPEPPDGLDFDERNGGEDFVGGGVYEESQSDLNGPIDLIRECGENSTRTLPSMKADFSAIEPASMGIRAVSAPGWHSTVSDDDEVGKDEGLAEDEMTTISMERAATYNTERMNQFASGMLASA